MLDSATPTELAKFLVRAKRSTYASQGDEASVPAALPGSKQLEFSEGDWQYRDVYFGNQAFAGIEVVSLDQHPVWSMSYAGGVVLHGSDRSRTRPVYAFLRQCLRHVGEDRPFRGPRHVQAGDFEYRDRSYGSVETFSGVEAISEKGVTVYRLRYAGRLID